MRPLAVGDYLLVAERVLGVPAARLRFELDLVTLAHALAAPFELVDGEPRHATLAQRAAVLASRLARARLVERGELVAFVAMKMFVSGNGHRCALPSSDEQRAVAMVARLVRGSLREYDFAAWIGEWIVPQTESAAGID